MSSVSSLYDLCQTDFFKRNSVSVTITLKTKHYAIMQYGTRHRSNESNRVNRLIELNDSYDTFCTQRGKLIRSGILKLVPTFLIDLFLTFLIDSFWNTYLVLA